MFLKRIWKARRGLGLNKFSINGQPPVEVVNEPDSVTEAGDPISADNLNDLENRIKAEFDSVQTGLDAEIPLRIEGDALNEALALGLVKTETFHATANSGTVSIPFDTYANYNALGVLDIYVGSVSSDYFFINDFTFMATQGEVLVKGYWAHNDTIYVKILYVKTS